MENGVTYATAQPLGLSLNLMCSVTKWDGLDLLAKALPKLKSIYCPENINIDSLSF